MKNTINSIRVAYENWLYEDRFNGLIALLKKYPGAIGQVALFTSSYHPPLPIDETAVRCDIMKERMRSLREAGFKAGINILGTIGHHNENLDHCYRSEANRMTNIHGHICEGSFCMRDKRFIDDYIKPVYTMLAKTHPDFIWVDDDVRCGHMPIGNGCFCDICIKDFNNAHGYSYTRDSLRAALNERDIPLRRQWLVHNGNAICSLFEVIGKTVRGISGQIILGFMTGERYFESYNFRAFAGALSENGKYEIMWRPGGGAYTDYSIYDFIHKAREIGRQSARLPAYVTVIQSEIENFPYQLIKKSPVNTVTESLLYMTTGCTGAAFNILPSETGEPVENCERHLKAIDSAVDDYKMLHEKLCGMKPFGIGSGWRTDAHAFAWGEWTASGTDFANYAAELYTFGLPECCGDTDIVAQTMNETTASAMDDDELLGALKGGIYMDAGALAHINTRGFGEYTGFAVGSAVPADAIERYLDHPFNGECAQGLRNCRQAFNPGPSISIIPADEHAIPLCSLVNYTGETIAGCSMGIFENKLGGRIAVEGYYPFSWISDYYKTYQLNEVFKYISKSALPAYIDSYHRIRTSAFKNDSRVCITLFNFTPDTIDKTGLVAKTDNKTITLYTGSEIMVLEAHSAAGGYTKFVIPSIKPWKVVLAEIKSDERQYRE
ncbi:MAG: hypothetical protein PHZ09_12655 [Eubacteriales bacterium]|nr:hypothetical protein [Eubacteriales bacterium]